MQDPPNPPLGTEKSGSQHTKSFGKISDCFIRNGFIEILICGSFDFLFFADLWDTISKEIPRTYGTHFIVPKPTDFAKSREMPIFDIKNVFFN